MSVHLKQVERLIEIFSGPDQSNTASSSVKKGGRSILNLLRSKKNKLNQLLSELAARLTSDEIEKFAGMAEPLTGIKKENLKKFISNPSDPDEQADLVRNLLKIGTTKGLEQAMANFTINGKSPSTDEPPPDSSRKKIGNFFQALDHKAAELGEKIRRHNEEEKKKEGWLKGLIR